MQGEMIVVVKCKGKEVGNMLLRRTRRLTHNNGRALIDMHYDAHRCCLGKGKASFTLDRPVECRAFKLKKIRCVLRWQTGTVEEFLTFAVCL